ncbi:hypothetical protein [Streptomyces sp. BK79]|uniref:hypothetical protein n=1 Tax=Streptomyces sp. BK79 TaxID=3350097 RepID=UPI0037705F23
MTTGSSTPRSPEYAISAVDLPTGETTTATGTHPVRSTAPDEPADVPDLDPPDPGFLDDLDDDLDDLGPRRPGLPDDLGPREPGLHGPDAPGTAAREYGDPVGDLVRAAVADRPLEEVVELITTLEQSPQYARATVDALRAVGVNRSVDDVTRLVGLLTRPPRHPDSADEAIRAAAECRSVEDVTRLMDLLHRTPLQPHCGQEAVRAAATGRPVEELVELIGRMAEDGRTRQDRPDARRPRAALDATGQDVTGQDMTGQDVTGHEEERKPAARRGGLAGAFGAAERRGRGERRRAPRPARRTREGADGTAPPDRERTAARSAGAVTWPAWLTVAVLAGCGVAYFPLHQNDASARAYGVALGLSALCLLLALLLTVRPAVPLLAAAVVAPAALAAAKLYGSATPSSRISRAVDLTLAPTRVAVAVAVLASLVALTALCVRVASQAPAGRRPNRPLVRASRATD